MNCSLYITQHKQEKHTKYRSAFSSFSPFFSHLFPSFARSGPVAFVWIVVCGWILSLFFCFYYFLLFFFVLHEYKQRITINTLLGVEGDDELLVV